MQKTTFPVRIVIHDDASTDNSPAIIREYEQRYPALIKVVYQKENTFTKPDKILRRKALSKLMIGRYTALCEGDDYWTDPLKLQKQIEFLEKNEDYGLVHTDFNYININNELISPPSVLHQGMRARIYNGYIWDYYLNNSGFILTASCVYRRSLLRKAHMRKPKHQIDGWLFMEIARQSKVYYIPQKTCNYRINPQGMMLSAGSHINSVYPYVKLDQILAFFDSKFNSNAFYKRSKTYWEILKCSKNCFIKLPSKEINSKIALMYISIKCSALLCGYKILELLKLK